GDEQSDFDEYESVTYGPYAPDEKIEVYATTEVEGKQFKSSVENVSSPKDDEDEIDVSLSFDDDAISDNEDKMIEKEEDSDDDGYVTEYDEDGEEVDSGY